jgi:hypothetical protein
VLKWSKPMVIAKFLNPNVIQLANTDTGVVVRKARVSHESESLLGNNY